MRFLRLFADAALFGQSPLANPLQKVAQKILRGPRKVSFRMRGGLADGMLFSCLSSHRYFFVREEYESDLISPLKRFVSPGSVVADVGAHFGYWALGLARICGSSGMVFAFEPSPENRNWLLENLQINSISNVYIIPLAVSDTQGIATISDDGSMCKLSSGAIEVETTTMDKFCETNPIPDFMLIDVEGFAGNVLRGSAASFREKFIPVICEIHHNQEWDEFRSFMEGQSAQIQILGSRSRLPFRALAHRSR
ncbi:MAG TPA: FkbM family methyltransferase [Candidatus Acidoferrales bacterium]|nr:FkbM family methyltransferase [Candidatus Acidoferrales bacterium]